MQHRQLGMILRDFASLPPLDLPSDCAIRTYRPGDEEAWARIMNDGLTSEWDTAKAREQLIDRPQFDSEGLFFAILRGEPVGSACAWRGSSEERESGIVHMVCVLPEARGKNLGYLVTLAVLHYFRDHGFSNATLSTDDFRVPAIKAYLRLGFEPLYYDDSHVERWKVIMKDIAPRH